MEARGPLWASMGRDGSSGTMVGNEFVEPEAGASSTERGFKTHEVWRMAE